ARAGLGVRHARQHCIRGSPGKQTDRGSARRHTMQRRPATGSVVQRSRWCIFHTMKDAPLARARRSLLGLAVGDAFGETLFGHPERVAARIAKRLLEPRRPWRWTDDTAMALSIVEVLGRHQCIDTDALAEAFVRRWMHDPHRGYGHGAFNLLARVSHGASWRTEAQRLFNGQGSYGNGAAMRAAPIGA